MGRFTTKELSLRTWPDYVQFFSQGNGWDHCGCTAYQGFRAPSKVRKWTDKRDWNLELKRELVERSLAHGILVYADGEPIGWCQFGPKSELPIPETKRKELLKGAPGWKRKGGSWEETTGGDDRVWRIMCFCTDKQFAQHGIAGIALRAAVEAIRNRGGGLIEAFPIATVPESDERLVAAKDWRRSLFKLIKVHGRFSDEVERYMSSPPPPIKVSVEGVGEVNGLGWTYGVMHAGTVAMFQRAGFTSVAAWGSGPRVVMNKRVRGSAR